MMEETGHLIQLIVGLLLAVGAFAFAYFASPRKVVPWLICLTPFQVIDTRYGSSSMALAFVVGIAYILRGKIRYLPMFGLFLAILAIYIVSTGFQHRATHIQHAIYIVSWVSTLMLFYIVYNFVRETKDIELVVRTLIILNIVVVIYSIVQITLGKQTFMGVEELAMVGARRGDEPRLAGTYGVGITAEFLVIHIFLCAYLLINAKTALQRNSLYLLTAINLGCLIATANRGGFLVLIGGAGLFLFMYRSQLGVRRTLSLSVAGIFGLVLSSVIVINFTSYGMLFQRLEATNIEGGVPDTREVTWQVAADRIPDKPLLGHGPRLRLHNDYTIKYRGHEAIPYPHSLYLFLLYTVGLIGLVAYLVLFGWLIVRIKRGIKNQYGDEFSRGLVKLGILIMIVFLIDQIKVEFLRISLVDYWHYVFSIFAIWLALADMSRNQNNQRARVG